VDFVWWLTKHPITLKMPEQGPAQKPYASDNRKPLNCMAQEFSTSGAHKQMVFGRYSLLSGRVTVTSLFQDWYADWQNPDLVRHEFLCLSAPCVLGNSLPRDASPCDEIDRKAPQPMPAFVVFARHRCKSSTSVLLGGRSDHG
jgi:hypothetical protein